MTEYTIWVGGDHPWNRSYLGEIGAVELTKEQVEKYFTFDGEDGIEFDQDLVAEKTDCWEPEKTDLPTWDTITDGCMGWGAYTDQMVGVCKTTEVNDPIFLADVESLSQYSREDIEAGMPAEDGQLTAVAEYEEELVYPSGVWILYNAYEKGGYSGVFELPDNVEFDPKKLVVNIRQIAESFSIVIGAEYDGEDIEMTGDSDGKGTDWYVAYKDNLICFR